MRVADHCELIEAVDVLRRLRADIAAAEKINIWCYTVEPMFFTTTFLANHLPKPIHILVDHKQRNRLLDIQRATPQLYVRCWQRNRTQHDKTIITYNPNVVWITTSNLHRGSFMLANNRSLRVTLPTLHRRMQEIFSDQWKISDPCEEES